MVFPLVVKIALVDYGIDVVLSVGLDIVNLVAMDLAFALCFLYTFGTLHNQL